MLRKNSMLPYKRKSMTDVEFKNLFYDDNYILGSCRPLHESEITKLSGENLKTFVNDVLTDVKLNQLLFSSNFKSEIDLANKTYSSLNKNYRIQSHRVTKEKEVNPNLMFHKREMKEAINKVVIEANSLKTERNERKTKLNLNNLKFYRKLKREKETDEENFAKSSHNYRTRRFLEIFNHIKEKLKNGIVLPDIEVDKDSVYSRLYFNVVHLSKNKQAPSKRDNPLIQDDKINEGKASKSKKIEFNLKNVISDTSGKEFTLKITERELTKCFLKHSGGPETRPLSKLYVSIPIIS